MSTPYEKEHIRMLRAIVKNLELMNQNLEDIKSIYICHYEIIEEEENENE